MFNERDLKKTRGFPLGINNRAEETRLPTDANGIPVAVRDAVNVDFTEAGGFRLRPGFAQRLMLAGSHSLWAHPEFPFMLVRAGGVLHAIDPSLTPEAIASGLGDAETSYCHLNGEVLFTAERVRTGRVSDLLAVEPLGIEVPAPPVLTATAGGGLAAGTYRVQVTAFSERGEESGASEPATIALDANAGIQCALPALPEGAVEFAVYLTEPDGAVPYRVAMGEGTLALSASLPRGRELDTADLAPLPPGHIIRECNGIVWVACDDALFHSRPLRPHLHHPGEDFIPLGSRITMVEPVGEGADAGLFVGHGRRVTYIAAATGRQSRMRMARAYGAVPGTSCTESGEFFGVEGVTEKVAYWFGSDGTPCIGLPGGRVQTLAPGAVMTPFERGATLLRESNGNRHAITAGPNAPTSTAAAGDVAEVRQYRNGILLP